MSATAGYKSLKDRFYQAMHSMMDEAMDAVFADIKQLEPKTCTEFLSTLVHDILLTGKFGSSEKNALVRLKQAGANFEGISNGKTPLLSALSSANVTAALWLIKQGVNVLAQDAHTQKTALMYAMLNGNYILLTSCFEAVPKEKYLKVVTLRDAQGFNVFDYLTLSGLRAGMVHTFVTTWREKNFVLFEALPAVEPADPLLRETPPLPPALVVQQNAASSLGRHAGEIPTFSWTTSRDSQTTSTGAKVHRFSPRNS